MDMQIHGDGYYRFFANVDVQASLSRNGDAKEAEKIRTIIEQFETTGPITGAST